MYYTAAMSGGFFAFTADGFAAKPEEGTAGNRSACYRVHKSDNHAAEHGELESGIGIQ
jgi:hypothetical protein